MKNILLLTYNPQHIQMTYTISRLAENNFEAKTKLKLNWLGFFVTMAEYSVIFSMLTDGLTKHFFFICDMVRLVLITSLLIL